MKKQKTRQKIFFPLIAFAKMQEKKTKTLSIKKIPIECKSSAEMATVDVGSRVGVGRDELEGKVPSIGVVAVVDS